jgi:hypothetical protein
MMGNCHLILSIIPLNSTITVACNQLLIRFRVPADTRVWISTQSRCVAHEEDFALHTVVDLDVTIRAADSYQVIIHAHVETIDLRVNVTEEVDDVELAVFSWDYLHFARLILLLLLDVHLLL